MFTEFYLALREAADKFKTPWRARLGLDRSPTIGKEHWTRVKAMSRRMTWGEDEYKELRPVAEFRRALQDAVSANLDQPKSWSRSGTDNEKRGVTNRIRQNAFRQLLELGRTRLVSSHKTEWVTAYEEYGKGSSYRRADIIDRINTDAAPSIGMDKDEQMLEFLAEIERIVRESIEAEGGSLS